MRVFLNWALAASAVAIAGLSGVQPAEAGRAYYCNCQGQIQMRRAGTFACKNYRLSIDNRPGVSRSRSCLGNEWDNFKSKACGENKCTVSDGFAYDAQQAKSKKK